MGGAVLPTSEGAEMDIVRKGAKGEMAINLDARRVRNKFEASVREALTAEDCVRKLAMSTAPDVDYISETTWSAAQIVFEEARQYAGLYVLAARERLEAEV